jgi:hypothetical protein
VLGFIIFLQVDLIYLDFFDNRAILLDAIFGRPFRRASPEIEFGNSGLQSLSLWLQVINIFRGLVSGSKTSRTAGDAFIQVCNQLPIVKGTEWWHWY